MGCTDPRGLGQLQPSYSLAETLKLLLPEEYTKRLQEVDDLLNVPANGEDPLPVILRNDPVYPGFTTEMYLLHDTWEAQAIQRA